MASSLRRRAGVVLRRLLRRRRPRGHRPGLNMDAENMALRFAYRKKAVPNVASPRTFEADSGTSG